MAVEYTNCFSAEGQEPLNECYRYYIKQSNGEVPVMLNTPLLTSLPGPQWRGVIAPDRILFMGQIDLN